jgi:hypothetical protein
LKAAAAFVACLRPCCPPLRRGIVGLHNRSAEDCLPICVAFDFLINRSVARFEIGGGKPLAKRAFHCAVASERRAAITGDSPAGSSCDIQRKPTSQR